MMAAPLRLNLGCCDRRFPGYVGVDRKPPADFVADLEAPWPWQDSTVAEIRAYDVIEHIGHCQHCSLEYSCELCYHYKEVLARMHSSFQWSPLSSRRRAFDGRIHVMNEAWRVLQPDGIFDIDVPTTEGRGAVQDPTHRTYWNLNSFKYYTAGDPHRERFDGMYGVIARFRVVDVIESALPEKVTKLKIKLRAVK